MMRTTRLAILLGATGALVGGAGASSDVAAQTKLTPSSFKVPAKRLFGAHKRGAKMRPEVIGFYSKGCLAGAEKLPDNGRYWQAMRLSRNRHWAHPQMISTIKRLAEDGAKYDGWPGLLVGDLAQPRGGPMTSGHASHQVGLDADIWLNPMPKRRYTRRERENVSAKSMRKDHLTIHPRFTEAHARIIKRAASYPWVQRVGVNHVIKRELCKWEKGDRKWLRKIGAWPGHHYHMHIRIRCPKDSPNCRSQREPRGDGCAAVEKWYQRGLAWRNMPAAKKRALIAKRRKNAKPRPKRRGIRLAGLPKQCRDVLTARAAPVRTPADEARAILKPTAQ